MNLMLLGCAVALTACSTTSENFDCKAGKGVGCKSITDVNQLVDQERLGVEDSLTQPITSNGTIHRIREEHLRVWIAPYQDENENLHESSLIHTVLKPGYWEVS